MRKERQRKEGATFQAVILLCGERTAAVAEEEDGPAFCGGVEVLARDGSRLFVDVTAAAMLAVGLSCLLLSLDDDDGADAPVSSRSLPFLFNASTYLSKPASTSAVIGDVNFLCRFFAFFLGGGISSNFAASSLQYVVCPRADLNVTRSLPSASQGKSPAVDKFHSAASLARSEAYFPGMRLMRPSCSRTHASWAFTTSASW